MAIIYNIPRIGETSAQKWGQRGPTCWYYVSKMLLKFHDKIQPASELYERFKALHELRKVLTLMGEQDKKADRDDKEKVIARLQGVSNEQRQQLSRREAAFRDLQLLLRAANGQKAVQLRDHINKLEQGMEKDRLELRRKSEAIEALKAYEDDDLARGKLFESFFPNGTFTVVEASVWLNNQELTPVRLEECLAAWGPCYAGGGFSVVRADRGDHGEKGGDAVVNVMELNANSAHAIVIAGVDGDTVYYKDPNRSNELATCTFDLFKQRISSKNDRLFISVWCEPDPSTGRCSHMDNKTLERPNWWD